MQKFNFEKEKLTEIKIVFKNFTKSFLSSNLRDRWNTLFDDHLKNWSKINPWDLWKTGNSLFFQTWEKSIMEIVTFFNSESIKKFYIIGLGHSMPFFEIIGIDDLNNFIKNKCITKNGLYWLEGLIITENKNIAFGKNHDGEILLFKK